MIFTVPSVKKCFFNNTIECYCENQEDLEKNSCLLI